MGNRSRLFFTFVIQVVGIQLLLTLIAILSTYLTAYIVHKFHADGSEWIEILSSYIWTYVIPINIVFSLLFTFYISKFFRPMFYVLKRVFRLYRKTEDDKEHTDQWNMAQNILTKAEKQIQKQEKNLQLEEEKWTTLLESINDSVIVINRHEDILYTNNMFVRHFGAYANHPSNKTKYWELFRRPEILNKLNQAFELKEGIEESSLEVDTLVGDKFFDFSIGILKDQKSRFKGVLVVFHDITELKMAEKMRTDFVANVSHEVRTPLTSIKGYAQMLKQAPHDPKLDISIDRILSNSEKLIDLVQDLLNLSSIESTGGLEFEACDIEEIIKSAWTNITQKHQRSDVEKVLSIEVESIMAVPSLLEQVLANYLDNAFKYLPKSEAKVTIEVKNLEDEVIFSVIDNGSGIPEKDIPRLFERFYRVDTSRSQIEKKGTGLGLAIVKHIVTKHNGRVWATSEVDKGSCFYAAFPINKS